MPWTSISTTLPGQPAHSGPGTYECQGGKSQCENDLIRGFGGQVLRDLCIATVDVENKRVGMPSVCLRELLGFEG